MGTRRGQRIDARLSSTLAALALAAVVLASCGGDGDGGSSGIPEPKPEWIADFQESYYVDLSGDPIVDTEGRYTDATIETLEDCGAGVDELEQLKDQVLAASPTSLGAPEEIELVTIGDQPLFEFKLTNSAANVYEITSCSQVP